MGLGRGGLGHLGVGQGTSHRSLKCAFNVRHDSLFSSVCDLPKTHISDIRKFPPGSLCPLISFTLS